MHSVFVATVISLMASAWAAPQFPFSYGYGLPASSGYALPVANSYGLAKTSSDKLSNDYTHNAAAADSGAQVVSVPVGVHPAAPVAVVPASSGPVYGYGLVPHVAYAPAQHVLGLGYGHVTYGLGGYSYGLRSLDYGKPSNERGYGF